MNTIVTVAKEHFVKLNNSIAQKSIYYMQVQKKHEWSDNNLIKGYLDGHWLLDFLIVLFSLKYINISN